MYIKYTQSLQLKQTLSLNHVMIQRFSVLQQSLQEFESSLVEVSESNPFLFVKIQPFDSVGGVVGESGASAIDYATYEESLLSVLMRQLDAQFLDDQTTDIVLYLIDHLDEKGFVSDYKNVRQNIKEMYGVDDRFVFKCLKILQSFEPDGIGARSINECLWNQIESYGLSNKQEESDLKELVKNHLDALSNQSYALIEEAMGLSASQLAKYVSFISKLNPVPTAGFVKNEIIQIQPSLRVTVQEGQLLVENLEAKRMSVHLNEDMIQKMIQNKDLKAQKQLANAKVWIEHFEKRQDLIKRCGDYLVQKQRLFFFEGDSYLMPCLQQDLAKELGVSDSTISRIVRTKYIEFNQSVFLIQMLCQRSIYGKTKTQVKALIGYYQKKFPGISDQKISDILKSVGLPIARRTVTKYRHETLRDGLND